MPRDHDIDWRAAAERRVRQKQEHERTALKKAQQAECRKDFLWQKQALGRLDEKETALREERRKALEREDRHWEREQRRLGSRSIHAPALALMAPPRNLQNEYERARMTYLTRREQLKDRFDERLADCQRRRTDKLHEFQSANQVRERYHREARLKQEDRQSKSYERQVTKEAQRLERGIGEEFTRKARAPERQI